MLFNIEFRRVTVKKSLTNKVCLKHIDNYWYFKAEKEVKIYEFSYCNQFHIFRKMIISEFVFISLTTTKKMEDCSKTDIVIHTCPNFAISIMKNQFNPLLSSKWSLHWYMTCFWTMNSSVSRFYS